MTDTSFPQYLRNVYLTLEAEQSQNSESNFEDFSHCLATNIGSWSYAQWTKWVFSILDLLVR